MKVHNRTLKIFCQSIPQINPQHVVPTLVDDGFALSESRAIILYLVDKYGEADSLYPSDPKKRAVVNHRLFFDIGTLYQRFADYYYPPILTKVPPNPEIFKKLEEAVGILNIYLDGQEFAAGSGFTVADISLIATVSSLDAAQFNLSKYPNVLRWFEKVKAVTPGYDSNEANLIELKSFLGL